MIITREEINEYLASVKTAIRAGQYRIELNDKRQDNRQLFIDYIIDEESVKQILLTLEVDDFSKRSPNEHEGFEHEQLYVFGKDVNLLERFGDAIKTVSLYIKFNFVEERYVIVISIHEQRYPMKYYFR
ncbi:MAG: hypothetical protein Q4A40_00260 [Bacillota bacterium]|nr:hypothetical protein [Bacillota bacterium]